MNQCELLYVNPLPASVTGVPVSEPQKVFRVWSDAHGDEWKEPLEDISFNARYRFKDKDGNPFGRLTPSSRIGGFFECELVVDQRVNRKGLHYRGVLDSRR